MARNESRTYESLATRRLMGHAEALVSAALRALWACRPAPPGGPDFARLKVYFWRLVFIFRISTKGDPRLNERTPLLKSNPAIEVRKTGQISNVIRPTSADLDRLNMRTEIASFSQPALESGNRTIEPQAQLISMEGTGAKQLDDFKSL
jgi:hypothetical protein